MRERVAKLVQANDVGKQKYQTPEPARNPLSYFPDNTIIDTILFRKASCTCGGGCPACQANSGNLKVSQPNDPAEIEADQIADRVMRMPVNQANSRKHARRSKPQPSSINSNSATIHRKCDGCEDEEGEMPIQRKALPATGSIPPQSPSHVRDAINSGGRPLDLETRNFFEPRLGYDLGSMRIHTGSMAENSARAVNAKAYALGGDIVFGSGEYAPHSESGRHLLAHELAHSIQQGSAGANKTIQRKIEVNPGVTLDTMGYTVTKSGNIYTCPRIEQSLLYHEVFTSMLFSPRVLKLAGATDAEANESRREHMYARMGVVDFASKKEYSFGAGIPKMNPEFWVVDPLNGRVSIRPGVDPQEAMEDLNSNPEEYAIGCQLATELTLIAGGRSPIKRTTGSVDEDWVPGDSGYLKNTEFPAFGAEPGTRGENIIYTGQDKFWGHYNPGLEYKTLLEWFDEIKSWNNGTGRAELSSQRNYPSAGLE